MPLKKNSSFVSLFDIRLHSADRDVVVLRGSPDDAASVLLSGTVILAAMDPFSIKRVSLRAQGVIRLRWTEYIHTARGPSQRPIRYEKTIFEHDWHDLKPRPSRALNTGGDGSQSSSSLSSSTTNLAALNSESASSSSSGHFRPGLHRSSSSHSITQGNHEFPFSMVIPGDIAESVEGVDGAQVVYKLTACVERGRFSNNMYSKKHFRVVRTLGPDSSEMAQTMSIDNTWPGKVEYTIETPSKAVAVGSSLQVRMMLQPLLKGLKLGKIRMQLIQSNTFTTATGATHSNEKVVHEQLTPAPEDGFLGRDQWDLAEQLDIPSSLAKVTQSVEVGQYIKVQHKLKFAIALVNPDGHVSELRASLPLVLFISPNVTISSFDPTAVVMPGREPEVETLFDHSRDMVHAASNSSDLMTANAPPNYESHVYDRLWNDVPQSTLNSPTESAESSPFVRSERGSSENLTENLGMTSAMDSQQRTQLAAGLRALERHQAGSSNNSSRSASGANTPRSPNINGGDYFGSGNGSPVLTPEPLDLNVEALSRVPSYDTAIKADGAASDVELAPSYDDPESSGPSSPQPQSQSQSQPQPQPGQGSRYMANRQAYHRPSSSVTSNSAPGSSANLNGMTPMNDVSSADLRKTNRNQSSSTLSSLLRSSSSKSLFGLGKKHHNGNANGHANGNGNANGHANGNGNGNSDHQ